MDPEGIFVHRLSRRRGLTIARAPLPSRAELVKNLRLPGNPRVGAFGQKSRNGEPRAPPM